MKFGFFASPAPGFPSECVDIMSAHSERGAIRKFSKLYNVNAGRIYRLDAEWVSCSTGEVQCTIWGVISTAFYSLVRSRHHFLDLKWERHRL